MATTTEKGPKPQKFDFFLVLDFEATCEDDKVISPQEIIEFPCLKVCSKSLQIKSEFHKYVRPVHHPILTNFCTELTGINQDMVHDEEAFPEVLKAFTNWFEEEKLADYSYTFVTSGDWDLKTCLRKQCQTSNLPLPSCFNQWINIKKSYNQAKGFFPRSLNTMLKDLDLEFEGRPHSGIDDCRNIYRIVRALANNGFVFDNTANSSPWCIE